MPVTDKGDCMDESGEQKESKPDREVFTPAEAARYLRIASARIYELLNSGQIAARNLGDKRRPNWRIHKDALERYLSPEPEVEVRRATRPKPKQIIK